MQHTQVHNWNAYAGKCEFAGLMVISNTETAPAAVHVPVGACVL